MRTFRIRAAMAKGWREAIQETERTKSFDPLIKYLRRPEAQLGPIECRFLASLLRRLKYGRKKLGRPVALGRLSARQSYESGAERVRELKREAKERGERRSTAAAISMVVQETPRFRADEGAAFANHIKRDFDGFMQH